MTADLELEELNILARQVYDQEHNVKVQHGLRGCDPSTIYITSDEGILFDIAGPNDKVRRALRAALIELLDGKPLPDRSKRDHGWQVQALNQNWRPVFDLKRLSKDNPRFVQQRVTSLIVRLEALMEEWVGASRRTNTKPCHPGSVYMDCADDVRTALDELEQSLGE